MWPLLAGCGGPPSLEAVASRGGLEVTSDRRMVRVEVTDDRGLPVVSQRMPSAARTVWLPASPAAGEVWTVRAEVRGGAVAVAEVGAAEPSPPEPPVASPDDVARWLEVTGTAFPTDALGRPDRTLPSDHIVRPALAALGVGWRPPPDQAPWSWQALSLANRGDAPIDLVVRASVRDTPDGAPVYAFRSRVRAQEGLDEVSVLLRIPPGQTATAALPVYADVAHAADGVYVRRLEVHPLGSDVVVATVERPLVLGSGSRLAPAAFAAAVVVSVSGFVWLGARGRVRLRILSTADLVTIALFGALTFVVGAAFQLLGFGIAAVLGPFAPLVSGVFDDTFRACLLGALVTTIPRVGVVAAATIVGAIMRALVLGSVHPVDVLFVGNVIALHEACLWLAGITRSDTWRDEAPAWRWLRLSAGFGVANAASVALGLATTAVLYRLYYATWYVGFLVLVPGLLYVALGCLLAVPFAASLRRVAP